MPERLAPWAKRFLPAPRWLELVHKRLKGAGPNF
jgi:hypothetical protein